MNYSKAEFQKDMITIATRFGLNPSDPKSWPKNIMFEVLDIKLKLGEDAAIARIRYYIKKYHKRHIF